MILICDYIDSKVILFEANAARRSGHYAEKAQLWVREAVRNYDEVTLVCFGEPSVAFPATVRILSLDSWLPERPGSRWRMKLKGNLDAWMGGWAVLREGRRTGASCLFLTASPLRIFLWLYCIWRPARAAQIVMNPGRGGELSKGSRRAFQVAAKNVWMCCNTRETASTLSKVADSSSRVVYSPDPIMEVEAGWPCEGGCRSVSHIFIPGDDDDRRSSLASLFERTADYTDLSFSLHDPSLVPTREAEIEQRLPVSWQFYRTYAADSKEFAGRFLAADAVLICYRHDVTFGSGNLVLALACRRPVIVSRFPAALELAESAGLIGEFFDEGDSGSLADAIRRLREWKDEEWSRFREAADGIRKRHGAENVCGEVFRRLESHD